MRPIRHTPLTLAAAILSLVLAVPATAQVVDAPMRQEVVQLHSATGRPVAPMMAHGERLSDSDFGDYNKDVKAVVDYVASLSFKQIVLTGSSFGSITITRYMVDTEAPRITASTDRRWRGRRSSWRRRPRSGNFAVSIHEIARIQAGGRLVTVKTLDGVGETLAGGEERAGWEMVRWAAAYTLAKVAANAAAAPAPAVSPTAAERSRSPHDTDPVGTADTVG